MPAQDTPAPKRRKGCLFYGLLTASLLLLMLLCGLLVGMRLARKMVNDFTDAAPASLPVVNVSSAELSALQARIENFRRALRSGRSVEPLVLSGNELNALIQHDPVFEVAKGKVHVVLEGGQLKGQISAPLDQLNLPVFRGRYLNATVEFDLAFRDGNLRVSPRGVFVKGRPLPEVYMDTLRKQNLAKGLKTEAEAGALLDRLEDVRLEGGHLLLVPKAGPQP